VGLRGQPCWATTVVLHVDKAVPSGDQRASCGLGRLVGAHDAAHSGARRSAHYDAGLTVARNGRPSGRMRLRDWLCAAVAPTVLGVPGGVVMAETAARTIPSRRGLRRHARQVSVHPPRPGEWFRMGTTATVAATRLRVPTLTCVSSVAVRLVVTQTPRLSGRVPSTACSRHGVDGHLVAPSTSRHSMQSREPFRRRTRRTCQTCKAPASCDQGHPPRDGWPWRSSSLSGRTRGRSNRGAGQDQHPQDPRRGSRCPRRGGSPGHLPPVRAPPPRRAAGTRSG
jgi:hypothetical protein